MSLLWIKPIGLAKGRDPPKAERAVGAHTVLFLLDGSQNGKIYFFLVLVKDRIYRSLTVVG